MKPIRIIATNLLLLFAFSASAQVIEPEDIENPFNTLSYGVKAGINYATVTKGNSNISPDGKLGLYAGIFGEIPIVNDLLSIQGELLYSRQGFERRQKTSEAEYIAEYNFDYLNLPILAKYYIVKGFSLEAGPQFGFKIHDKIHAPFSTEEHPIPQEIDDFDISFAVGTSFQFDEGLFISIRYTHGLKDVIKETEAKNTAIQVGLGYKF
ncbi:porin family protein [uncultured Flavobacterium sp.]|uniref:porin family protein n=1 Tax=uncultured Flavobacterium sp. TaxID=165435 RepID=UPI0025D8594E|nr:porin family protein [uncultured Flavobacterium sp.]